MNNQYFTTASPNKKKQWQISGLAFCRRILTLSAMSIVVAHAHASELVYTPVNPAFGGNPMNGATLMNAAQAQNKKKDPEAVSSRKAETPLEQFNTTLQRSVLSRLASAATSQVIGNNGKLVPGIVETGDFRIEVSDLGGGSLQITTTDSVTGATTSFRVTQ